MASPKEWVENISTSVVANIIAGSILVGLTALIGLIIAYITKEPVITLLVMVAVLLLLNTIFTVFLVYLLRKPLLELQESFQDLSQQSREFQDIAQSSPLFRQPSTGDSSSRLHTLFPITDKYFDEDSQKIVIRFTNKADSPFYVRKIVYSDDELKDSLIEYQRKESGSSRVLLDFDKSDNAQVAPQQNFTLEIKLKQTWKPQDINLIMGELAYLRIFVDHKDKENEEMFYSI